ncbi:MBG domain-containing protein [Schleiferilactobacillus shenzhenensis]|uniref:Ssp2 n=1 Tax=Schleiferilactobacillus shenzhenensis LY-73 TaxID=1231336 RepID=U4TIR5_9LACO|nr:MBG domain-containing protein [Schleiferilactobacillus shenzhenensis]ERL64711.1 ssp2 [Schleiferilactobacillus shenzhenensis LY-73]
MNKTIVRFTLHKSKKRWLVIGTSLLVVAGLSSFTPGRAQAATDGAGTAVPAKDTLRSGQDNATAVSENPTSESLALGRDAGLAAPEPASAPLENDHVAVTPAMAPAVTTTEQRETVDHTPETIGKADLNPSAAATTPTEPATVPPTSAPLTQPADSVQSSEKALASLPNGPTIEAADSPNAPAADGKNESNTASTEETPTKDSPAGETAQKAPVTAKDALANAQTLSTQGGTLTNWIPDVNFRNQVIAALQTAKLLPAGQGADQVTPAMISALTSLQLGRMVEATAPDGVKAPDVQTADPQQSVADLTGIGIFSGLQKLTLTDNRFTTVPDEISQLTNLTDLVITRNQQLTHIGDLSGLHNVTNLAITNNGKLTELPASISTLTNVTGTLDLHGNSFTALPDLSSLQKVTTLDLNNNRLTDIADGHLDQLTHLTTLNLGSYDGANYQEFITGLGHDLNSGGDLANPDFFDAVPRGENNVHLNYDPRTPVPNMTLRTGNTTYTYAYPDVFTEPDLAHYNHLSALPAALGQLTNLQSLNLVGNDLTDLPTTFSQLHNLTNLQLGNNRFTAIPAAVQALVGTNPKLSLSFSNYLANYPSFGTYRNQNSILQSEIWDTSTGGFRIAGWNPAQDQVLSQVIKFPQHYVVTYNSTSFTILDAANPLVPGEKVNDSQLIQINGIYYLGPETLVTSPTAKTGVVIQQFVHYPNNQPNGTDHLGQKTAGSLNAWNFGDGYYGGMYDATNDVFTVGTANQTRDSQGNVLPLYPYQDPYLAQGPSTPTTWRGVLGQNFYYMILLPRNWSPDGDNLNKTYALNFSVGGKYAENAPDGGASNGTGAMNGFIQPDSTGYSMVATTDVTFVLDGALAVQGKSSSIPQGHVWDPAQGFAGAVRNDTDQTTITSWYDTAGKVNPGLGVQLYEVVPTNKGLQVLRTFKDAADFNQNATAFQYADNLHTAFAYGPDGQKIQRFYIATYNYLDKTSNPVQILVTDDSTLTLKDSTTTANTQWHLADAAFAATDPNGTTPLAETTTATTDQVAVTIVDDADPSVVYDTVAAFNAGKRAGHTYTVTAKTYDQRAASGQSTQLFLLKEAQAKITVTKDAVQLHYGLHGTDGKVYDGQPGVLDPTKYQVTVSDGTTYQPVAGDLAFQESPVVAPGSYHVILTPAGTAHVQAGQPAAVWTFDGSRGTYVITPKDEPTPPVNPDNPNPPVNPVTPDNPNPPVIPDTPNPPVNPVTPDQPHTPVTPAEPNEPAKPDKPSVPETPTKPDTRTDNTHTSTAGSSRLTPTSTRTVQNKAPQVAGQAVKQAAARLPQTDEKTSFGLMIAGLISTLLAGVGLLKMKRRDEDNEDEQ